MPQAAIARVALDVPLPEPFDYRTAANWQPQPGDWVIVPWGRARRVGLVVGLAEATDVPDDKLRSLEAPLPDLPRASAEWLDLIGFGARYYHAGLGELALPAVPKLLRAVPTGRTRGSPVLRARARFRARAGEVAGDRGDHGHDDDGQGSDGQGSDGQDGGGERGGDGQGEGKQRGDGQRANDADAAPHDPAALDRPDLTDEQVAALAAIESVPGHAVHLLHGITGSGKTEVYFRWIERRLADDPAAQALVLVPEIALTPQLAQRIGARFPDWPLAVLHSDMPDAERAAHWLAAAEGRARIVLGTRLAVLAPLPGLAAIVVDEEHDASFKQQEGPRYSARDLAIVLGARRGLPVVLGSATPSLETWHAVRRGRYRIATLKARAGGAALPSVHRIALQGAKTRHGLTDTAIAAIESTIARGEQALVFLNRRGYAPVLSCGACAWLSRCDQCDAYRVLHRLGPAVRAADEADAGAATRSGKPARYRLVCHHCGTERLPPRTCPDCGNVDLAGLGRGTQRLEEGLQTLFPSARIGRLDRDVARRRGAAQSLLDAAHAGEVDLLVGTQMLAKGHDFRRLTLVVVADADAGLFAADFRAPERLFATLMQVAGRAGRHHAASRVVIQTRYPDHPVYVALAAHDYDRFAAQQLKEREAAGLPPFVHQALLTAHARTPEAPVAFLAQARETLLARDTEPPIDEAVLASLFVCDPVPMPLAQMRGDHRAQMLVESASRAALHAAIGPWLATLHARKSSVRWQLVVDPLEI